MAIGIKQIGLLFFFIPIGNGTACHLLDFILYAHRFNKATSELFIADATCAIQFVFFGIHFMQSLKFIEVKRGACSGRFSSI